VDYAGLLRDAHRRAVPPVALLHGPEPLLLDDAVRAVSAAIFADASGGAFDREVLDGRETTAETVARSAMTLPFLASRRLIVVKHAEALSARNNDTLRAYLAAPSPSACLLLLAEESLRADRARKADHWLLQAVPPGSAIELTPPRGAALERALQQRARVDGLDVSDEAARLLVQFVGDDLGLLLGEAHKAALAGGPDNRRIGADEVGAVVGEHRLSDLFDLVRAVERGESGRAQVLLDHLLRAGEEPLRLLGLLCGELRTMWTVKEWARRGLPTAEIARRLRRPPAALDRMLARAEALDASDLAGRLRRCWQVELAIKTGGRASAEMAILVADLC
jgi:DNA polymerase III subunit delta